MLITEAPITKYWLANVCVIQTVSHQTWSGALSNGMFPVRNESGAEVMTFVERSGLEIPRHSPSSHMVPLALGVPVDEVHLGSW
jgi:hypothetical protein